jgi:hypothetical protein
MSSVQRAIVQDREAQRPLRVVDALGYDGVALCRPGSRHLTAGSATADSAVLAVQHQNVTSAYLRATFDAENAWRRGPGSEDANTNALGTEFDNGREGDACTVRAGAAMGYMEGSPGHLVRVGGKLLCMPDMPMQQTNMPTRRAAMPMQQAIVPARRSDSVSTIDAEAIKRKAWEDAGREAAEAWRNLGQH